MTQGDMQQIKQRRRDPSPMDPKEAASLRRIGRNRFKARNFLESLGFALEGLVFIFRTQRNFRIDVCIALGVFTLGMALHLEPMAWAPLVAIMGLVLFAEAMNTAIEYTVDLYTQGEFDMRAKAIKDIAAGACLMCAVSAALVGTCIFAPRLLALVGFRF